MGIDPETLVADFLKVAKIALVNVPPGAISVFPQPAPHRPNPLPKDKMAVYVFFWKSKCLKVGRVGKNSRARYVGQHYKPSSSMSNLSKSILSAPEARGLPGLTEASVGPWIKTNTDRYNFVMDSKIGIQVLYLLEVFLQCRLKPMFEGFKSQQS